MATFASNLSRVVDQERGRRSRDRVISEASNLDPTSPDYFQKRTNLIARNPAALNDRAVLTFFDMADDVAVMADRERAREDAFNFRRQQEEQDFRQQLFEDQQKTREELADDFDDLGSAGQSVMKQFIAQGAPPEVLREALSQAKIADRKEALELEYMALTGSPPPGPVTEEMVARKKGEIAIEKREGNDDDERGRIERAIEIKKDRQRRLIDMHNDIEGAEAIEEEIRELENRLLGGVTMSGRDAGVQGGEPGKQTISAKVADRIKSIFDRTVADADLAS